MFSHFHFYYKNIDLKSLKYWINGEKLKSNKEKVEINISLVFKLTETLTVNFFFLIVKINSNEYIWNTTGGVDEGVPEFI